MLPTRELSRLVQERFAALESGDPNRVAALYSEGAQYWDTKCTERLRGREAVVAHACAFVADFDVRYALLEEHRLEGRDAAIVLWESAVRKRLPSGALGRDIVMQRGMNLLQIKDGAICRDEAFMDLAALDALRNAT
jgi:ketosteroid isomerase-like protein